jgi:phosphomannomutase / phosphoglucomutase
MSIFKACDVRGVVGEEWGADDARRIGQALGQMLRTRGEAAICVGGDFRRSTLPLKASLVDGLRNAGLAVCDVGQQPTPVVNFAARYLGCRNVAVVTASHNPARYNGVKFIVAGQPPSPPLIRELIDQLPVPPSGPRGTLESRELTAEYASWVQREAKALVAASAAFSIHSAAQPERSPTTGLSVVLDAMAGTFTRIAPQVLAAAGYTVHALTPDIDPDYASRNPDPSNDSNLASLIQTVLARRAAAGVALDGDGDRVIFVDQDGKVARPEQIAALLIQQCFERPTVVYDLKCASLVAQVAAAAGGTAIMQPSGHGFIKSAMQQAGAELGVEVSGHHFFGALDGGDDGLFTALVILELMRRRQSGLGDLLRPFGWPAITPDLRIPFTGNSGAVLDALAARCGGRVTRLDGVRAEYDGGWALARASITEPAITFRFEGRDDDHLRQIAERFLAAAGPLGDQVLERMNKKTDAATKSG